MKTKHTMLISCILLAGIIISGLAFAGDWGNRGQRGAGFHRPNRAFALMLLVKYQQENLMVQTLSDLTGQPLETIQAKLKDQRMRSVMQEFNIDRQVFQNAMQANVKESIKQAAVNGTITVEQQKDILTKIENRIKRRELIRQLIEKGIEDGTVTQEQAQMLMRKPR